uniref:DNA polymerase kappa n=1 Tax=Trichuris muris TaxID=70415 RepID=A0A5S6QRN4_TRIMR
MEFNNCKAGMQGLDRETIGAKINEWSKGTRFYDHQMKRRERIDRRVKNMRTQLGLFTEQQLKTSEEKMDKYAANLESTRDLSRTFFHVDMDAFFAAVEMRDDPKLRNVPMAVGSSSMLSTSNYLARKFGVRAAMPGFIGKKLCPDLVIVPCNFAKYRVVSGQVEAILQEYDSTLVMGSLDEAYLDLTEFIAGRKHLEDPVKRTRLRYGGPCSCANPSFALPSVLPENGCDLTGENCDICGLRRLRLADEVTFGHTAQEVAKEIRFRIEQATQLTCSIGIACNGMLAKVCSDINKPNGQFYLEPDRTAIIDFVHNLPIRKICGIGPVTEAVLRGLDITTCKDLFERRAQLYMLFSQRSSAYFLRISLGIDGWTFEKDEESTRKSIGIERTFNEINKPEQLLDVCRELCNSVAKSALKRNLKGRTVTVKLKTIAFDVMTRASTAKYYTNDAEEMFSIASEVLLNEIRTIAPNPLRLRLMGVRLSSLQPERKGIFPFASIQSFVKAATPSRSPSPPAEPSEACANSSDQTSTYSQFTCPVCNSVIEGIDLRAINQHVDVCLNVNAIEELRTGIATGERQAASSSALPAGKRAATCCATSKRPRKLQPIKQTRGNLLDYFARPQRERESERRSANSILQGDSELAPTVVGWISAFGAADHFRGHKIEPTAPGANWRTSTSCFGRSALDWKLAGAARFPVRNGIGDVEAPTVAAFLVRLFPGSRCRQMPWRQTAALRHWCT